MKTTPISFLLKGISTNQFALIKESYQEGQEIKIESNLRFGVDKDNAGIIVIFNVKLDCGDSPFLVLEIACEFDIEKKSFESLKDSDKKSITLPMNFSRHLAVLTVGTSRGVLHAKLEHTDFKQFFLPTINVTNL